MTIDLLETAWHSDGINSGELCPGCDLDISVGPGERDEELVISCACGSALALL